MLDVLDEVVASCLRFFSRTEYGAVHVVFFSLAQNPNIPLLSSKVAQTNVDFLILKAISLGSVLLGAVTYIGNAPNFMVKSIAEERGVRMPSFFGYLLWSLVILIPTFIFFSLLFL